MISCNTMREVSLLSLIESLQQKLTNEKDADERCEALQEIGEHIVERGASYSEQEAHFVCEFLAAKLASDSIQVIPAVLDCSVKLFANKIPNSDSQLALKDVIRVLKASLDELYVQSFTQSTRLMSYKLCILGLKLLSDDWSSYKGQHEEALKLLGGAEHVILQVIRMVDGEKDPRNLLHTFHLIQILASWRHLQSHMYVLSEELFEVFSCYFPIEFRNEEEEKLDKEIGVSRSDLKTALMNCFMATDLFAEHAIPFFLDKLTAEVILCKVDTFEALKKCTKKYLLSQDEMKFIEYSQQLWFGMFSELTTSGNELVLKECYEYFASFLEVIFDKTVKSDVQIDVMKVILKDTTRHFAGVGTKTHKLTLCLFVQCVPHVATSDADFGFFFEEVLGSIVKTAVESTHQLSKCLPSINNLLEALSKYPQIKFPSETEEKLNRLLFLLMEIFQSASEKLTSEDRVKDCLTGLTHLVKFDLISKADGFLLVCWTVMTSAYWKLMSNEAKSQMNFLDLYLNLFKAMLKNCSNETLNLAFQQLVHQKQNLLESGDKSRSLIDLQFYLILMQCPCEFVASYGMALDLHLDCLQRVSFTRDSERAICKEVRARTEQEVFSFFQHGELVFVNRIAKKILTNFKSCIQEESPKLETRSQFLSDLLLVLTQKLEINDFDQEFQEISEKVLSEKSDCFNDTIFCAYCLSATEKSLAKQNCIPFILSNHDKFSSLLPVLINRCEDLTQYMSYLDMIGREDFILNDQAKCCQLLMTCHALIRRGYLKRPITKALLEKYLGSLDDGMGNYLATNSSMLVNGFDEERAVKLKLKTRPMFVQQLAYELVPQILDLKTRVSHDDDPAQGNWILCLMSFLQCLPDTIMATVTSSANRNKQHSLMQIILSAIKLKRAHDSTDKTYNDVIICALSLLSSSMQFDNEDVVQGIHAELLSLSKEGNDVSVRVKSLKCLAKVGKEQGSCKDWLKSDVKRKTKRTVDACLDDRKRVVRREAVTCKTAWDNFGL